MSTKPKSIALSDWQLAGLARGAVSMVVVRVKHDRGADRIIWVDDAQLYPPRKGDKRYSGWVAQVDKLNGLHLPIECPYSVGDEVIVKERFQFWTEFNATPTRDVPANAGINFPDDGNVWDAKIRPARSMPLSRARYRLRLESVGVKRVCEITEAEAYATAIERLEIIPNTLHGIPVHPMTSTYVEAFKAEYISQHGSASFASDWAFFCGVEVSR